VRLGSANYSSLVNSLVTIGFYDVEISENVTENELDILIFPGVGSFSSLKRCLGNQKNRQVIKTLFNQGHPMIGICLGLQLFCNSSEEDISVKGLGCIDAEVKPLPVDVSHVGWSPVLESSNYGVVSKYYYFNHKYYLNVTDPEAEVIHVVGNGVKIPAIVKKNNYTGFQFHPEKSGFDGLALLRRTINELGDR